MQRKHEHTKEHTRTHNAVSTIITRSRGEDTRTLSKFDIFLQLYTYTHTHTEVAIGEGGGRASIVEGLQ